MVKKKKKSLVALTQGIKTHTNVFLDFITVIIRILEFALFRFTVAQESK